MADDPDLVAMTIEVVANYVAHNNIAPDDVPGFIAKTHAAIKQLNAPEVPEQDVAVETAPAYVPAVSVRKSLGSRDHILSMIDGKPYKTLKRHLRGHGLTPAQYRERYSLKADYPMVAPAYSDQRREVARTLGLGQRVKGKADPAPTLSPKVSAKAGGNAKQAPAVAQAPARKLGAPKAASVKAASKPAPKKVPLKPRRAAKGVPVAAASPEN
jgi:predicted transcriptional regulator